MQFDLTDDQRAIQETARDFLAARYKPEEIRRLALDTIDGFTQEGWDAIADLGWPGLVVPEADGGLGLGAVELCVIQEQLGYALAPTPFLSTVAGGLLLAAAGTDAQRERWLAPLARAPSAPPSPAGTRTRPSAPRAPRPWSPTRARSRARRSR
jgi:alkylation response protein AidB-like acyl-CoA dehydrogenase